MTRSIKFWISVSIAAIVSAWLLEIPAEALPIVAVAYVALQLAIDHWQKSGPSP